MMMEVPNCRPQVRKDSPNEDGVDRTLAVAAVLVGVPQQLQGPSRRLASVRLHMGHDSVFCRPQLEVLRLHILVCDLLQESCHGQAYDHRQRLQGSCLL